jgi:hypothetical protein
MSAPSIVIRSVTLPVAAPADMTWKELDAILTPAFRAATELANWSVHQMFKRDVPGPECPKTLKAKNKDNPTGLYLYGIAKSEFSRLGEAVEGGYRIGGVHNPEGGGQVP